MRKMVLALAASLSLSTSAVASDATMALIGMVVAEQYCGLKAPSDQVEITGKGAMKETGMSGQALVTATYAAADAAAKKMVEDRTLVAFCAEIERVYRRHGR